MKQCKVTMDLKTHAKILAAKNRVGISRMDQVLGALLMAWSDTHDIERIAFCIVQGLPSYMEAVVLAEKPKPRKRKPKGKGTA